MKLNQFSPQTQQTLAKRDFNQDQQLSARELQVYAQVPSAPGIEQHDLLVIQKALKEAKTPATIIVSLIDESTAAPGYKAPEALFQEPGSKDKDKSKKPAEVKPAVNLEIQLNPKTGSAKPDSKSAKDKSSSQSSDQEPTGLDIKTQAQYQNIKLQSTTSYSQSDTQSLKAQASASYQAAPNWGVEIGAEALPAKAKAEPRTEKAGAKSKKPAAPVPAPASSSEIQLPQNVRLNGQIQAGQIKVRTRAQFDERNSYLKEVVTTGELTVLPGHVLKAENVPTTAKNKQTLNWNSYQLGSSHQVYSGLSLTSSIKVNTTGQIEQYRSGFNYDYGGGLSFTGEVVSKTLEDKTTLKPVTGLDSLDFRIGSRFTRTF